MASSTSSTSGAGTVSNGRYWGLASGLDVDSIVQGLLTKEQAKVNKAEQAKQNLQWKQSAYRDIINKLTAFENAYLLSGSDTSMAASEMYTSYAATSNNSILSVTANSDADGINETVDVLQSATAAALKNSTAVSGNITGTAGFNSATDTSAALSTLLSGKSLKVTVDDVTKTISFDSSDFANSSDNNIVTILNNKLKAAFGTTDGTTAKVSASYSSGTSGDLVLKASASTTQIKLATSDSSNDAVTALGFTSGQSNRLGLGQNIGTFLSSKGCNVSGSFSLNINGTAVALNSTMTVSDALSAINSSKAGVTAAYNSTDDTFTLTSNQGGTSGAITVSNNSVGSTDCSKTTSFLNAFGIANTDTSQATANYTPGRDAEIKIGNNTFYRSTNDFTINGVTYKINGSVDSTVPSTQVKGIGVSFTQDSSKLKAGLQKFISAYNDLITAIHTQVNTKPDSDYYPLSDAQKKDMSQTQIDNWNAKAQQGELFDDSTLQSICDSMRSVLYKKVQMSDGSYMSIYDLGITTSDNYDDYGKLEVKPEDQAKFDNAVNTEAGKIKQLFTKASYTPLDFSKYANHDDQVQRTNEEGLVDRLDDIVKESAGYWDGAFGSLVQIAGTTSLYTTKNEIYNELKDKDDTITELKELLQTKQDRLYRKFEKLETYMSQANSQSSLISSFGSNK